MQEKSPYVFRHNENDHEFVIVGSLRPYDESELEPLQSCFEEAAAHASSVLYVNLTRLRQLNHTGFVHLVRIVRKLVTARPDLNIKLFLSSMIPWAKARFQPMTRIWPRVVLEQSERAFYPGQQIIDNHMLIPVLRSQTQLLWPHEKERLQKLGLRAGMRVADICCGIGNFALLLRKTFDPEVVVAIDHSQRFIEYARSLLKEFQIDRVECRLGDATHMLLPDNSFDFVICRLSLQIFDRPDQIVRELYRICKPGGCVYIGNEIMSHNFGYPHTESIRSAFREMVEICGSQGIDMNFGPKAAVYLKDEGFEDVQIELLEVNNTNSDTDDFVQMIEAWLEYAVGEEGIATDQPAEVIERIRSGHEDFIGAVRHRRGFASWPVYLTTARKPEL